MVEAGSEVALTVVAEPTGCCVGVDWNWSWAQGELVGAGVALTGRGAATALTGTGAGARGASVGTGLVLTGIGAGVPSTGTRLGLRLGWHRLGQCWNGK